MTRRKSSEELDLYIKRILAEQVVDYVFDDDDNSFDEFYFDEDDLD